MKKRTLIPEKVEQKFEAGDILVTLTRSGRFTDEPSVFRHVQMWHGYRLCWSDGSIDAAEAQAMFNECKKDAARTLAVQAMGLG